MGWAIRDGDGVRFGSGRVGCRDGRCGASTLEPGLAQETQHLLFGFLRSGTLCIIGCDGLVLCFSSSDKNFWQTCLMSNLNGLALIHLHSFLFSSQSLEVALSDAVCLSHATCV